MPQKTTRTALFLFVDLCILLGSFLIAVWVKPATVRIYIPMMVYPFLVLLALWIPASFLFKKYNLDRYTSPKKILYSILVADLVIFSFTSLLIYTVQLGHFSRLVVMGTFGIAFILEISLGYVVYAFKTAKKSPFDYRVDAPSEFPAIELDTPPEIEKQERSVVKDSSLIQSVIEVVGVGVCNFISEFVDLENPKTLFVATSTMFNITKLRQNYYNSLVNVKKINDIRWLNKFFETVNARIPEKGYFVCCVETYTTRKRRIFKKYPAVIAHIYYFFDFIFKRVFPKIWGIKKIYFAITSGRNRVISKAETLGRLVSCGFQIVEMRRYNNLLYIVSRKVAEPVFDLSPTYGPLVGMTRIGKDGKHIKVYKFRTMHPYSEYLQEYIYAKHDLKEGGKFKDDFRITTSGKIMRKLWIDELPMLVNLVKGELKIFGVRPLSRQYFGLYTKELQERRVKYKPGLVPPFYVDKPKNIEEIMASELKYLDAYEKRPMVTDIIWLFKALTNILFKRYRSA